MCKRYLGLMDECKFTSIWCNKGGLCLPIFACDSELSRGYGGNESDTCFSEVIISCLWKEVIVEEEVNRRLSDSRDVERVIAKYIVATSGDRFAI